MHRIRFVNQKPCDLTKVSIPTLVLAAAALDAWPGPRTAQSRPPALAASPSGLGGPLCGAPLVFCICPMPPAPTKQARGR